MAWEVKRLGDVCEVGDGNYSSKYPKASEFIEKGIPFLTATNLKNGTIVPDGMRFISEHLHKSLKKGHVIKDDLVIVVRGSSTGNNSKIPKNYEGANLNSQLAFLRVKDTKLDSAYLFAAFNNPFVMDKVKSLISGSAQPQLPINKLVSIEIPIPPLAEQKRIVAMLDSSFSAISKAKENAEKNLKNSKELFESYLNNIFEKKGKDWEEKKLGEVCRLKPPKSEARDKLKATDSVSFVPMEDMGINQKYFIPEKERTLKEVEGSYTYFANGDVLLAKITPCFENGKLGIATNLKNEIGFGSSEYIVFRVNKGLLSEYLYYYLSRGKFREEGASRMMGAVGHKRVAKEFVENYPIPLPPLSEQKRIVAKLDALSEQTKKLEAVYLKKIADFDELKKSILQKAFRGEL